MKLLKKTESNLKILEKKIKIKFKNKNLLQKALTHRSYLNEHPELKLEHNERLEFLGDAVLEMIVTQSLFNKLNWSEGGLTLLRSNLVNAKMLSELAKELNLNDFLLLSKGEGLSSGKARGTILADTFEALIGAIFLDQGFKKTDEFVKRTLLFKLPAILGKNILTDPKSKFQEIVQANKKITPVYKVLKEAGPDHNKKFTVGVYIGDDLIASGEGSSKQEAETNAAKNALTPRL